MVTRELHLFQNLPNQPSSKFKENHLIQASVLSIEKFFPKPHLSLVRMDHMFIPKLISDEGNGFTTAGFHHHDPVSGARRPTCLSREMEGLVLLRQPRVPAAVSMTLLLLFLSLFCHSFLVSTPRSPFLKAP